MDTALLPGYPPTLPRVLRNALREFADRAFLVTRSETFTYADAERISGELARGLLAMGIGKETRVALLMPNSPQWVFIWLALGRIGALEILASTLYEPPELSWLLRRADVDTLLVATEFAGHDYLERLERALPGLREHKSKQIALRSHPFLRRIIAWGDADRDWAFHGPADVVKAASGSGIDAAFLEAAEAAVTPADPFLAICTSGSTAEPKIVVHTHGSVIRAVHINRPYRMLTPGERILAAMPLFWLGGLNVNLIPAIFEGASLAFAPSPKVEDLVDTIVDCRVTMVLHEQVVRRAICERAKERGVDVSRIRGLDEPRDANGQPVPPERRVDRRLGMTETFGPHGVEVLDSILPEERAGSSGHAIEGIGRRIVDPESGATLPPGEVGELQVRGFSLMQGYYKKERSEAFLPDGWLATGDLCRLDEDGYVYFQGRRTEVIKCKGANVAPREVEVALEELPDVLEATVLGVPDESQGEAVVAVVVARVGATIDGKALRSLLKGTISSYKIPSTILVARFDDLPRGASGKVRKADLRALLPRLQ